MVRRILSGIAAVVLLGSLTVSAPMFAQGKKGDSKKSEVPAPERCIAKTQDGDHCKRKAADGSKYCWQHDPNRKAKGGKKKT
jgi:hypothetical protein